MSDIGRIPSPRLEVRDLRVVLALARAGTTARAAPVLHLTQPAVSRALLALEEKLGARIFERTPRGLVATPMGERLLAGASQVLVELGDLERRVCAREAPSRLRLVCECYTAYHWLPSAMVAFRKSLAGMELALAIEHTRAPIEALEAGAIDVALVTLSAIPRTLGSCALFADELVFVVAASHPLARREALTLADVREHVLLVSTGTPPALGPWFVSKVFGRARPPLRFERFPLTEAILDVARAGMGVAVLSEWIVGPHLERGDLVAKRLAKGPLIRPWRFVYRREVEDAALRLLPALKLTAPRSRLTRRAT